MSMLCIQGVTALGDMQSAWYQITSCVAAPCQPVSRCRSQRVAWYHLWGIGWVRSQQPTCPDADNFVCAQSTIPAILGAVAKVLNAGDESAAQEVLENLVEVAEAHPRFLRKQLPDVVTATLQVRP